MMQERIRKAMRKRLLDKAGVIERIDLVAFRRTEWSSEFERLMRNRLIMGALRYGRSGTEEKAQYDCIGSCISRLKKYQQTGNKEHLVDAANLCLIEFIEGRHPHAHFASIDDGEHVSRLESADGHTTRS